MKYHFNEKVINQGYLDSIQGDLEYRLEIYDAKLTTEETPEERRKTIENHILVLKTVKIWFEELWTDYIEMDKQLKALQHEKEQRLQG